MDAREFLEMAASICENQTDCEKCPLTVYCVDFGLMGKMKDTVIDTVRENAVAAYWVSYETFVAMMVLMERARKNAGRMTAVIFPVRGPQSGVRKVKDITHRVPLFVTSTIISDIITICNEMNAPWVTLTQEKELKNDRRVVFECFDKAVKDAITFIGES